MNVVPPREDREHETPEWWRGGRRPSCDDLMTAATLLTVLPRRHVEAPRIDGSALFYPLIGLVLGGVWIGFDRIVTPLPAWMRAAMVLAAWVAVTGGRQLAGFARTSGAVVVARSRQQALVAMASTRIDSGGALAAEVVSALALLGLQWRSLTVLNHSRLPALLFAPLLASWSRVVLAHGSRAARSDGRQIKYASDVTFREFAVASVCTFGVLFSLAQAAGIVVGVCAAVIVVGLRLSFHWWLGGITDAAVGAGAEIVLTLVLALFAAFEAGSVIS